MIQARYTGEPFTVVGIRVPTGALVKIVNEFAIFGTNFLTLEYKKHIIRVNLESIARELFKEI